MSEAKARELLERAQKVLSRVDKYMKVDAFYGSDLQREIRAYLAAVPAPPAEPPREQIARELLQAWYQSGCPDCSGDCGSANPPVSSCLPRMTREWLYAAPAAEPVAQPEQQPNKAAPMPDAAGQPRSGYQCGESTPPPANEGGIPSAATTHEPVAQQPPELTRPTVSLRAGEMTAGEWRTVRAILDDCARRIRALATAEAPRTVALEPSGTCPVCGVHGFHQCAAPAEAPPALPENLIDGTGCDYMRGYAAAERDNASLQADEERARIGWDYECDDLDRVLARLGLDPQAYRTDGGRLNRPKLESALAAKDARIESDAARIRALEAERDAAYSSIKHYAEIYRKVELKYAAERQGRELLQRWLRLNYHGPGSGLAADTQAFLATPDSAASPTGEAK